MSQDAPNDTTLTESEKGDLSLLAMGLYCLPAIPLAAMGIVFFVHLPKFHASEVGIGLGLVSLALFVSRSWDAVTDPVIGYFSDRITRPVFQETRLGFVWKLDVWGRVLLGLL